MTQEDKRYFQDKLCNERDKELLLKDLLARLPYGVKVLVDNKTWCDFDGRTPSEITFDNSYRLLFLGTKLGYVKPYLFPMSSMTDEQKIRSIAIQDMGPSYYHLLIDRYNEWHLDYRGLIEKDLAIDATNKNIY